MRTLEGASRDAAYALAQKTTTSLRVVGRFRNSARSPSNLYTPVRAFVEARAARAIVPRFAIRSASTDEVIPLSGVFISYRRKDASQAAGRVYEHLSTEFGNAAVFIDVLSTAPGQHFEERLEDALANCTALVAIIGSRWLQFAKQRQSDPRDWVRREIESAIARELLVVPVLIDDAQMPAADQMPKELRALSKCQALRVTHEQFGLQIEPLVTGLREALGATTGTCIACPQCKRSLPVSRSATTVLCSSCNIRIPILRVVRSLQSDEYADAQEQARLNELMRDAEIDFEEANYTAAHEGYSRILTDHPRSWEALVNKAICSFWLGREDLEHLAGVLAMLNKADVISTSHPRVALARMNIAVSLALIASRKERAGPNIPWAFRVFRLSRDLERRHEGRDAVVDEYCERLFREAQGRLLRLAAQRKKRFDPPLGELRALHQAIELSRIIVPNELLFFLVMACYKRGIGRPSEELEEWIESSESVLRQLGVTEMPELKVSCSKRGKWKVEGLPSGMTWHELAAVSN